jgi:hypothetical protein
MHSCATRHCSTRSCARRHDVMRTGPTIGLMPIDLTPLGAVRIVRKHFSKHFESRFAMPCGWISFAWP